MTIGSLLPLPGNGPDPAFAGLDLLATAVLLLDDALAIVGANAAAENLFELAKAKLVGRSLRDVFADAGGLLAAVAKSRAAGAAYTEQELLLTVPGKATRHLSCTVSPVDARGAALLLELRHIDQQLKIAREERLQEQQQANRELIRNLAHEIKNPLGGIRGAAQLLERELDAPPLLEYTQVIIAEADRLRALVNRLLTPHRVPTFRRTNIHEILAQVRSVVQAEFPQVAIASDFDTSLPELDADPEQLTQAILNVVRNAAQALTGGWPSIAPPLPEPGRLSGTAAPPPGPAAASASEPHSAAAAPGPGGSTDIPAPVRGPRGSSTVRGPEIRISTRIARGVTLARRRHRLVLSLAIADNGPGIPAALRDRIFYPLVSGREGGSGLGLTLAQAFVAQHQGTIECESTPGRTVFTILLPLEPRRGGSPPG